MFVCGEIQHTPHCIYGLSSVSDTGFDCLCTHAILVWRFGHFNSKKLKCIHKCELIFNCDINLSVLWRVCHCFHVHRRALSIFINVLLLSLCLFTYGLPPLELFKPFLLKLMVSTCCWRWGIPGTHAEGLQSCESQTKPVGYICAGLLLAPSGMAKSFVEIIVLKKEIHQVDKLKA